MSPMSRSAPHLDKFSRAALVDSQGRAFLELRRSLRPRYWRVWFDIALGYSVIAAVLVAVILVERALPYTWPALALLCGLGVGYGLAFIQLFFHEAAHYLIAPSKRSNDLLANLAIGAVVGQDIRDYRAFHFEHHRKLGTPEDTERSYFDSVDLRFAVRALTGSKLLEAMRLRNEFRKRSQPSDRDRLRIVLALMMAAVLNAVVVLTAAASGIWSIAVGWPVAMLVIFPALNVLRQALEHRAFDAKSGTDYSVVPHGPMTRMFGRGLIASSLGGAGFNRHLLHHWEPQISYTRFGELQRFLLDTDAGAALLESSTTYGTALSRLARQ